jgi:hypothetical protein
MLKVVHVLSTGIQDRDVTFSPVAKANINYIIYEFFKL